MKITADTNILVRAITGEHASQSKAAQTELAEVPALSHERLRQPGAWLKR